MIAARDFICCERLCDSEESNMAVLEQSKLLDTKVIRREKK
jgi:hypothetical protein